jgi:hypothetical protein
VHCTCTCTYIPGFVIAQALVWSMSCAGARLRADHAGRTRLAKRVSRRELHCDHRADTVPDTPHPVTTALPPPHSALAGRAARKPTATMGKLTRLEIYSMCALARNCADAC